MHQSDTKNDKQLRSQEHEQYKVNNIEQSLDHEDGGSLEKAKKKQKPYQET